MRPGETAETAERLAAAGFDDLPAEVPLARLDAFFSTIGPAHERAAPEPHWYLRLLGVEPAHQGQGLGSILLDTASVARTRPASPATSRRLRNATCRSISDTASSSSWTKRNL